MKIDRKTIVIGLDGATFEVLDPYIKKGDLPNIDYMMRQGVRGNLEAAIPPVTGPSWVSFMTGMGPGKHGIFDFVQRMPSSLKRIPVTYQDIRAKTLWNSLNEAGKSVGVANLPITYPAPEVNGFIIPGLLTPSDDGEFAYPVGLMAEIRKNIGEYVLDVWWQRYGEAGPDRFLKDLLHCTEQRIKTFWYLLENKPCDFFMGVFIGSDRIQHYLWHLIHPDFPDKLTSAEQKIVAMIREYYIQVDKFIGALVERYSKNANIFIVSDHGFGLLRKKMYINRWLTEQGYLTVRRNKALLLPFKKRMISYLRPLIRKFDLFGMRTRIGYSLRIIGRMSAYNFLDCIDWSTSRAYSASNTEQGIYLNLRGREPNGIVSNDGEYEVLRDEIIQKLRELKDPVTGEKVVSLISKREDLYNGPCVENAPDIVIFLKNGEYLIDVQLKDTLFEEAAWHTGFGTHRLEGIFIGCGPEIKKGTIINGARIIDIAPTILYLNGLPIPKAMDGCPLLHIIKEEILAIHPVSYSNEAENVSSDAKPMHTLSRQEMDEVEEKLKGLGYL